MGNTNRVPYSYIQRAWNAHQLRLTNWNRLSCLRPYDSGVTHFVLVAYQARTRLFRSPGRTVSLLYCSLCCSLDRTASILCDSRSVAFSLASFGVSVVFRWFAWLPRLLHRVSFALFLRRYFAWCRALLLPFSLTLKIGSCLAPSPPATYKLISELTLKSRTIIINR